MNVSCHKRGERGEAFSIALETRRGKAMGGTPKESPRRISNREKKRERGSFQSGGEKRKGESRVYSPDEKKERRKKTDHYLVTKKKEGRGGRAISLLKWWKKKFKPSQV